MATATPWGMSDYKKKYAIGINFYGTPSHGGYKVSDKKNQMIPDYMRNLNGWYEEDCEWAKVVVCFPDVFETEHVEMAKNTLKNWFPDAYEKFYGVKLKEGESFVRDKELFKERHKNDYIVVSAINSDKYTDMVECFAIIGGSRKNFTESEGKTFLVPIEEYQNRNHDFVIDPSRHTEI